MRFLRAFLPALFVCSLLATAAEPQLEIKEGDRVLFLGDVLLEREGTYGAIETLLTRNFADRHFTVRNLSWSGDTPLGVARASFDPPAQGWEKLREQLDLVKPTVAFLGFGMAASLQEMTDRSGDILLNRDTARYGAEPMTSARFKTELGQLMDAVQKAAGGPVRFVLLSPLAHEDLRGQKPGLPDPAAHNALLAEYSKGDRDAGGGAPGALLIAAAFPSGSQAPEPDSERHSPDEQGIRDCGGRNGGGAGLE